MVHGNRSRNQNRYESSSKSNFNKPANNRFHIHIVTNGIFIYLFIWVNVRLVLIRDFIKTAEDKMNKKVFFFPFSYFAICHFIRKICARNSIFIYQIARRKWSDYYFQPIHVQHNRIEWKKSRNGKLVIILDYFYGNCFLNSSFFFPFE